MIKVYCYSKCSTCRKALKWLSDNNIEFTSIDLKSQWPSKQEMREYIEKSALPLKKHFNTSGVQYKALELSKKLPLMSEEEALDILTSDGMLVKRPLLIADDLVLVGFKEEEWEKQLL